MKPRLFNRFRFRHTAAVRVALMVFPSLAGCVSYPGYLETPVAESWASEIHAPLALADHWYVDTNGKEVRQRILIINDLEHPGLLQAIAESERRSSGRTREPTNLSARLAGEFFKKRNYPKCREMASKATRLSDHHPLGSYWLARLSLVVGDTERAHELLEPALNRQAPDPRVLELLADLETRAKRYDTARSLYELGGQQFPTESKWVSGAARIALLTEDHHTLREKLEQLCQLVAEDVAPRRKLASLAAAERDWMRAVQFASMTLHIDVLDAEPHSILAQAYAAQERWPDAVEEYLTLQARESTETLPACFRP